MIFIKWFKNSKQNFGMPLLLILFDFTLPDYNVLLIKSIKKIKKYPNSKLTFCCHLMLCSCFQSMKDPQDHLKQSISILLYQKLPFHEKYFPLLHQSIHELEDQKDYGQFHVDLIHFFSSIRANSQTMGARSRYCTVSETPQKKDSERCMFIV